MLSQRNAELDKWHTALASDEAELKDGSNRRANIPEHINVLKKRIADLSAQLQTPPPSDESSPANSARRLILVAQRRTAEQEIPCSEKELAASEARTELLPPSRDLNVRRIALAEQEVKQWQETVNRRRQQEAEQQARHATREAAQADPALRLLVEHNADLAETRKSFAAHIVEATNQLERINHDLSDLEGAVPAHQRQGRGGRKDEHHQRHRRRAAEAPRNAAQTARPSPQCHRPRTSAGRRRAGVG